ncbi:hypothetical protein [Chitinilyticum litopenaei]|uniref:hypothetical protein n=1 Tax=Chitinilyticum litopenaei TaxID=1121276 RepID=UPI00040DEFB9|nr:hypothetical protein [Chitinilyticum litopenaei]
MRLLLCCLLSVLSLQAVAEVSKCRRADGSLMFTDQPCPAGTLKEALSPGASISVVDAFDVPAPTPVPKPVQAAPAEPDAAPASKAQERKCPEDDERCVDDWPPQIMDESFEGSGGYDDQDRRLRPGRRPVVTPH